MTKVVPRGTDSYRAFSGLSVICGRLGSHRDKKPTFLVVGTHYAPGLRVDRLSEDDQLEKNFWALDTRDTATLFCRKCHHAVKIRAENMELIAMKMRDAGVSQIDLDALEAILDISSNA